MGELHLGIKVEGADIDVAQLRTFFAGTNSFSFTALIALWNKMTKVTISEITITAASVNTITEDVIYETPTPP